MLINAAVSHLSRVLFTLKEEHKNEVLRRIFGPKRNEIKLHNEELRNLYHSSPDVIRMIR
jgi:hypothetical protein